MILKRHCIETLPYFLTHFSYYTYPDSTPHRPPPSSNTHRDIPTESTLANGRPELGLTKLFSLNVYRQRRATDLDTFK